MEKSKGANKYLIILLLLFISVWGVFKYLNYTKYDNKVGYTFAVNEAIDLNYHNQTLVRQYFENIYRLQTFAQEQWYNFDIDVQTPDHENPQSILASQVFDQMRSEIDYAERLLLQSKKWKEEGFDNTAVEQMEKSGLSPKAYQQSLTFARVEMAINDRGEDIRALQKRLDELGYDIPVTGLFSSITEECILDFQLKHNLFPTGVVDQKTLQLLITD